MENEFSFRTRNQALKEVATQELDLVVIGGGITGAGIAWDAASRGIRTAAFERRDFAHATSGKTSKMIHGGLRYLRNLEFSLVRESLRKRKILLENARELVSWLPLIIPLFSPWDTLKFRAGLVLYDALAKEPGRKHRRLKKKQVLTAVPFLETAALRGGLQYWDAVMDDSRLNLAVMASAARNGALIPITLRSRISSSRAVGCLESGSVTESRARASWFEHVRSSMLRVPGAKRSTRSPDRLLLFGYDPTGALT